MVILQYVEGEEHSDAEHCGPAAPVYLVPALEMWNIATLMLHSGAVMWSQMQTLQSDTQRRWQG